MSSPNAARLAVGQISFNGTDITSDIKPYLLAMAYTDNEADESDDLQITLQDRDGIWLDAWLADMLEASAATDSTETEAAEAAAQEQPTVRFGSNGDTVALMQGYLVELGESLPKYGVDGYFGSETQAAVKSFQSKNGLDADGICGPKTWAKIYELLAAGESSGTGGSAGGFSITAAILRENWNGEGKDKVLDCGAFELDCVSVSGPPATVVIKATALPFTATVRQTKKSRAWESYCLSGIAEEMAASGGMTAMFLSDSDPYYARVEQYRESDIVFLSTLCRNAGLSLKVTDTMIVVFDPAKYEASDPVFTLKKGAGAYTKYKLEIGEADAQYASCVVSYVDPATGASISGTAEATDAGNSEQVLEVYAKVSSIAEAQTLAAKLLRQRNRQEQTASFTVPGNPDLVAGVTVELESFGLFDGKYLVTQAKHSIGGSGYVTQIALRKTESDA